MIKKIDHIVLRTSNLQKCVEFYERVGFKYRSFNNRHELLMDDFKLNIHIECDSYYPVSANTGNGSLDICFESGWAMDDILGNLNTNSIDILCGPVARNGIYGEMQSVYFKDFDGNLIEICTYNI